MCVHVHVCVYMYVLVHVCVSSMDVIHPMIKVAATVVGGQSIYLKVCSHADSSSTLEDNRCQKSVDISNLLSLKRLIRTHAWTMAKS